MTKRTPNQIKCEVDLLNLIEKAKNLRALIVTFENGSRSITNPIKADVKVKDDTVYLAFSQPENDEQYLDWLNAINKANMLLDGVKEQREYMMNQPDFYKAIQLRVELLTITD